MLTDVQVALLEQAWRPARAAGVLGAASVEELWSHTAGYLSAVCRRFGPTLADLALRVVDVGSGAGLPGVLLALGLPRCEFVLMDSQERRCDLARHAVSAVGLSDRVSIVHCRADDAGHDSAYRLRFDVAVARLLGPPPETVELLAPLVRDGGLCVVSSSVEGLKSWQQAPLIRAGCMVSEDSSTPQGAFVTLRRDGVLDASLPRRKSVRQREPLF